MPENMSICRRKLIKAFGGDLLFTQAELGMRGAIDEAEKLSCDHDIYMTRQFENPSSIKAHYLTTAPEIDMQMNCKVDAIVCGVGTGGTITGIANYFYGRNVKIIGVEPIKSPFLTKGYSGLHNIQGIGAGFCPKILNIDLIDEIIAVSDEDALFYARILLEKYGLFVGISSGAVYRAALEISEREEFANKSIVIICADGGDRYL
jgi:cysteine synthase A